MKRLFLLLAFSSALGAQVQIGPNVQVGAASSSGGGIGSSSQVVGNYTFWVSSGTVYAMNNSTGAVTSNTDAAALINGILAANSLGGKFYFKNGIYPINTLTQETTSGWTTYYYGIGIPATPSTQWGQFSFEGESRPAWNWGADQNGGTAVQNNGVIFLISSSALSGIASSNMVVGIFQRPGTTYAYSNEDYFKSLGIRFPSGAETRGNITGIAMWMASAIGYENVTADFNDAPHAFATGGIAPVAGTLGSFGLTGTYGSQGLPQRFNADVVWGWNIGFDWNEHTLSYGDDAYFCNYPWEIGRSVATYHSSYIERFMDQENAGGGIFGPQLQVASRVDMPQYDIELANGSQWFAGRGGPNFTETNAGYSLGIIDYSIVKASVGGIFPAPALFTTGGTAFCVNRVSDGCALPISYGFSVVENPLSASGHFTAVDSTGMAKVISNGIAEPITAGTNAYGIYTGAKWPNNQYSQVTALTDSDVSNFLVLYTNVTSLATENAYQLNITPPNCNIIAYVAGVAHTIATCSTTVTFHANDVFSLNRVGSSSAVLTVNQITNGVTTQLISFTDSTYASSIQNGSPGFALYAPTTIASLQISNWTGGTP